jgi:glycosyltransferase involved in cell wall biosynthesis
MPTVVRDVPDAVLLVTEYAADPEYRQQIAHRIKELGLEKHVQFCGHVAHADMPEYYSLAEITVAVPSSDGLPQTLLEGMACETPSVLARLPRYEEIVEDRVSAYFVDDHPEAIAAGIIELFNAPQLRATIARNAIAIVRERASLDEQAARVERKFRELAATVPRRTCSPARGWGAWRAYRKFRATGPR